VTGKGTIEEFWASANQHRLTYSFGGNSETIFWTSKGAFRSGGPAASYFVTALRDQIVQPFPNEGDLQRRDFAIQHRDGGAMKLDCLAPGLGGVAATSTHLFAPSYCLESGTAVLRLSVTRQGGNQILRNDITEFQGRFVPRELKMMFSGKPVATASVDSLEELKTIEPNDFVPPAGSLPTLRTITVSSGVAQGMLLKKTDPVYPSAAKAAGIDGTVDILATISTAGRVVRLQAIGGPFELRIAALEAVGQWIYRPYVLNGEPVEVQTTVHVEFRWKK